MAYLPSGPVTADSVVPPELKRIVTPAIGRPAQGLPAAGSIGEHGTAITRPLTVPSSGDGLEPGN